MHMSHAHMNHPSFTFVSLAGRAVQTGPLFFEVALVDDAIVIQCDGYHVQPGPIMLAHAAQLADDAELLALHEAVLGAIAEGVTRVRVADLLDEVRRARP